MRPMVLYLCQHGEALAKDVDPDRPLSESGTTDVCNVANALADNVYIGRVVHSGKTRARQTAELMHERLTPETPLEVEPGLGPKDPVADFAARLDAQSTNLLVVGHMPFLGNLASRLLGETRRNIVAFQPGSVAALERNSEGDWQLCWMLTPALVSD